MAGFMPQIDPMDPSAAPVASTAAPTGIDPLAGLLLKRQQEAARLKILQALIGNKDDFSKGQMIGDRYVGPSPLSGIGRVASALGGAYVQKKASDKDAELAQQYLTARQGQIAGVTGAQSRADVLPYAGSSDDAVQAVVKAQLDRLKPETTSVAGHLVRSVGDAAPAEIGNYNEKWTQSGTAPDEGLLYTSDRGDAKSVGSPPRPPTVNVGVNIPNLTKSEIVKKRVEDLQSGLALTQEAPSRMEGIHQAAKILESGDYLKGNLAPLQGAVAQTLRSFGIEPGKAAMNSEEFKSALFPELLEVLRKFAPVTDTDRAYAERFVNDPSRLPPAALGRLVKAAERSVRAKVADYNTNRKFIGSIAGEMGDDPSVWENAYPQAQMPDTFPGADEGGGSATPAGGRTYTLKSGKVITLTPEDEARLRGVP